MVMCKINNKNNKHIAFALGTNEIYDLWIWNLEPHLNWNIPIERVKWVNKTNNVTNVNRFQFFFALDATAKYGFITFLVIP